MLHLLRIVLRISVIIRVEAADINGVNRKHDYYSKYFVIDNNCDTKLIIFAVENDGSLAMESKRFLKWLTDQTNQEYSLQIRTTLSVCIQSIRARQLIFTRNNLGRISVY